MHTTKAETKASKVSKIPVSKLDSSVFSRTTKGATSGANDSRRNQIAQPGSFVHMCFYNDCMIKFLMLFR